MTKQYGKDMQLPDRRLKYSVDRSIEAGVA